MGPLKLKMNAMLQRRISIAMIAVTAVMGADLIYQVTRHIQWRGWISEVHAAAFPTTQPAASQPSTTQPASSQPATQAAAPAPPSPPKPGPPAGAPREVNPLLKKRNIFTEPPQKGHGVRLTGVIGRVALFATRDGGTVGVEEGQSGAGVKVTSIRNYEVVIEYQGKPETLKLFP